MEQITTDIQYLIGGIVAFIGIIATYFKSNPKARKMVVSIFDKIIKRITGRQTNDNITEGFNKMQLINIQNNTQINENTEKILMIEKTLLNIETTLIDNSQTTKDILSFVKKGKEADNFNRKIKDIINNFINDNSLENTDFGIFISSLDSTLSLYFNSFIKFGLKNYNSNLIETEFSEKFENKTPCKNISNCNEISDEINKRVVLKNITSFVSDFKTIQISLDNGKLLKSFEKICFDFVENIIKQSYKIYSK